MPDESVSRYVGGSVSVGNPHCFGSVAVELLHDMDGMLDLRFWSLAALYRGCQDAAPDRLGQHDHIAGLRAVVTDLVSRAHMSNHCEPIFGFVVFNGVPADDYRAGEVGGICATAKNLARCCRVQAARKACDVECQHRGAADGVDI